MLKAKDKLTIAISVLSTALLVLAVVCSIMFAAFTANKQANTTISFHEGIDIEINGVSSGAWLYNGTGSTAGPFSSTSGNVVDGLALSPIGLRVTKGASTTTPTYVRVFVVFATTSATATLPTPTGTGITYSQLSGDTGWVDGERDFVNSITSTLGASQVVAYAGTSQFTATSESFSNIINAVQVFQSNGNENAHNGEQFRAYFRIYASTSSTDWGENYSYSF